MKLNQKPVEQKCIHFPKCGGCQFLDKDYPSQLYHKKRTLQQLFSFERKLEIPDIVGSPVSARYRHKLQLPFGFEKEGKYTKLILGCHEAQSQKVVNQKECYIQDNTLSGIAYLIRSWAIKNKFAPYNPKTGKGDLRHILLKKAAGSHEILIGIVTNFDRIPGSRNLSKSLLLEIEKKLGPEKDNIAGIVQNINMRDTHVVLGQKEICWWGRPYIFETLGAYRFAVGLSTFFQVNPWQTPQLFNEVKSHIKGKPDVLDLYCGVGAISLWVSDVSREVLGIEENSNSISIAKKAASKNGVQNVKFECAKAEEILTRQNIGNFELAIMDPPRKGLHSALVSQLRESKIKKLIYVSCNPETLARDVKALSSKYRISCLKGFDMFPHTEHLESVAVLDAL